ncbi:thioredoxin domain-containing protein, partial [Biomphalaria pfeifferi]
FYSLTMMQFWTKNFFLLAFVNNIIVLAQEVSEIVDVDISKWQTSLDGKQKLLVLFYQTENCESCTVALNVLNQIVGQPELPSGMYFINYYIQIGKSTDLSLAEQINIVTFPSLVFLRDNSYAVYDDVFEIERMLEWIQLAAQKTTVELNDLSFEHLTQASTGATTGDWFVAFYKDSCDTVLPAIESLGVRVRNKMNVAKVNVAESPLLEERFKISKCPEIIYFKQGKMYRYDFPLQDMTTFKSFIDGFYKNVKQEVVPTPKSKFDYLTEHIANLIKQQLNGENRTAFIAGVGGVAAVLFLLMFCCCCRSSGGQSKKQKRD